MEDVLLDKLVVTEVDDVVVVGVDTVELDEVEVELLTLELDEVDVELLTLELDEELVLQLKRKVLIIKRIIYADTLLTLLATFKRCHVDVEILLIYCMISLLEKNLPAKTPLGQLFTFHIILSK